MTRRSSPGGQKNDKKWKFLKILRINFFQNFSQNYKQKYEKIDYFQIKNCLITRRAGCLHPNSKSNTVLGKILKNEVCNISVKLRIWNQKLKKAHSFKFRFHCINTNDDFLCTRLEKYEKNYLYVIWISFNGAFLWQKFAS